MATRRTQGLKKKMDIDAINDLIAIAQKQAEEGSDEARPHISKQDVNEAVFGKKRTGAPRAIKSKGGMTVAEPIKIIPPKLVNAKLILVGDSPLITNCWSWKTIQKLLRDHMQITNENAKVAKKGKKVRDAKNPFDIFINSMYEHRDGGYGFPSNGVKRAITSACSFVNSVSPKYVGGAVRINGELIQLLGTPRARFDMVNVKDNYGNRKPDTRFRAQFDEWAAEVNITFASSIINLEDIANLFVWAGTAVGIGEWRPEKEGNNGTFHVADEIEAKKILKTLKVADRKKVTEANSGINDILEKYGVFEFDEAA